MTTVQEKNFHRVPSTSVAHGPTVETANRVNVGQWKRECKGVLRLKEVHELGVDV